LTLAASVPRIVRDPVAATSINGVRIRSYGPMSLRPGAKTKIILRAAKDAR
jgi:hypothetical protein